MTTSTSVTRCTFCVAAALLVIVVAPREIVARVSPTSQSSATSKPVLATTSGARLDALERELRALRAKVKAQDETIESLADEGDGEDADKLAALAGGSGPGPLQIYGFFDVMFHRLFMKEGSIFDGLLNDTGSFLINRLNVYLGKQITESFSALIELRFTFSPLGNTTELGIPAYDVPFQRVDTTVIDPYAGSRFRLGGVMIERAYATYRPHDAFGIRAGYFLSPFGVWNEDHGSPVIVSIRQPLLLLEQPIPLAQMGLQVFGRFFPSNRLTFDYALTFSNGRGPMDTVFDLDDHKALGLRLKLGYQRGDLQVYFDAYGYWGKYTGDKQEIVSFLPWKVDRIDTEVYTETAIATSLLVKWNRLHWQSELVVAEVRYDVRPQATGGQFGLRADHNKLHAYSLFAYRLPLEKWIGAASLRPYALVEYEDRDDTYDLGRGIATTFGLNLQPFAGLTLKAEVFSFYLLSDLRNGGHQFWGSTAQMAVAF